MCHSEVIDKVTVGVKSAGAQRVERVAPEEHGGLLFACDGCVYRLAEREDREPADYMRCASRLADFAG